ncbi:type VI secretion system baseplate subunit TssF [Rahnella woolbedingensis]|uniref:Type VI secretion system baseplate subunit TssF n=1 Tax=Rahnella woolbedingensis TaxID=1510574 RepID=A0A419N336_9GAMM|nr:type VI secretion system baseplate subunit TssF [Rahnella woolbedingensis]RJT36252.1 type VI secretion system baseplate subunit TssF [Rahnella woolbedingensis]
MDRLLPYYQKELAFLKQHGKAFASRFPKIARRLGMIDGESEDPHVERIIESFALLTSRIHQRLDDDMPEVTEALLTTLAPQFLRAMPSTCIVSIAPNHQTTGMTCKNTLAAGTQLFSRHIDEGVCQFQTVYPIELLPLTVKNASLNFEKNDLNWHLDLSFQVWSGAAMAGGPLRLFLHGPNNAVNILYTLLCSAVETLTLYHEDRVYTLNKGAVKSVGFQQQESLIKQDPRVLPIHVLLQDYFFFPQKFHFLDIQLPDEFNGKSNDTFRLAFVFSRSHLNHSLEKLAGIIDADFFQLHCSPAINLFTQRAEPITLTENTAEYPVIPDIRYQQQVDVWAINHVFVQCKQDNDIAVYPVHPLFGIDHSRLEGSAEIYWQSFVRETLTSKGTDSKAFIAFANRNMKPSTPQADIITISLTCTNHNIPNQMKNGHPEGDFDSDLPLAGLKINALSRPTRPVPPPAKSALRWQLISQLSLNHMLLSGSQGVDVLRETLMLYNFHNQPAITHIINMILQLEVEPIVARLVAHDPCSLARGIALTLTFSHEALNEPEYYLLCCFLEQFLGLYSPVNSFTRVTTLIEHEEHTRHVWPIRAGKLSWI